jgi:hypothetical protein
MTLIICNKNISFFWQICIFSVNSVLIRLPQVSLSRAQVWRVRGVALPKNFLNSTTSIQNGDSRSNK